MIVSIDIGTSYSSICILGPDGKAQPVDISTGASMFGSKYSMPTAVFVEEDGSIQVGQAALNSRRHTPQNFRMEFKRNLGEDTPILLGGRSFKPEDLYTEIFRHMKERAEKVTGEPVGRAILTYPASYGEMRREKLCIAAKAAGLFDLQLVDEPTAAAMCYCAQGYVRDGQALLVYDFGGGTFDASLIRYENGKFRLLAEPAGLERCGGMDIDYLIARDMREAVEKEYPGTWDGMKKNQRRFMRFTSQLNEMAVKAKHHLSDAGAFNEYIDLGMDDVDYRLTREQFNQMAASLLGQTVQVCQKLLRDAQMSPSDLSAVLLVGGTSRIPLVQEMAGKIMGKPPLCAADLELSVVRGALMYLHKQEEIEREQKKRQEAKELEEKEKRRKEAEERERKQREAARQKKAEEDENLVLGRYVETFIFNYPYLINGIGDFSGTYEDMFREQVNIPVQEKVLLANVHLNVVSKETHGTVFTNKGIYYKGFSEYGYRKYFTSWRKYAVSELIIRQDVPENIVDSVFGSVVNFTFPVDSIVLLVDYRNVDGGHEKCANFIINKESSEAQNEILYRFFPRLQKYLLSKVQI